VLVTGASGFAGSHLLEHLARSTPITAWSRLPPPSGLAPLATWLRVDLLDRDAVRRNIAALKPARIFHCAGVPHVAASWHDTAAPLRGNVLATHHLFDAVERSGHSCRILITGSATVYARADRPLREDDPLQPASPYGFSKLAQEHLGLKGLGAPGIDVVATRSFNHTGPRQTADFAAPAMARQIALIERGVVPAVLRVGNLDPVRDLTDVRDVVRAYAMLMEHGAPGTAYNVASGVGHSIRELLEALVSRASVKVDIAVDPDRFRPNDTPMVVGDARRLREVTGWGPQVQFDRMLDDLLTYWRQQAIGN
jgi:GDP-4-dehydro-6-deoxy-D-mannose reductase